ncbi:MAG: radical SAM protein [Syntrophobacteraceae bacterium]
MHFNPPRKILVETEAAESRLMETLRETLPEAAVEVVEHLSDKPGHDPTLLEVAAFRGRFLKSCPGTRHYHCCGYKILHFGVQCSLECTYCILQAYLQTQPNLRLFGNLDDLYGELDQALSSHPNELFRIGTGEFTDSLLLDPWTRFSKTLVPFFAKRSNAILELKTKTNFIENLSSLDHNGHVITAWSLNAEAVRNREEPFAATLRERLEAARMCAGWGYWLAFHFDPMIDCPDWERGYGEILDRLFETIDPSRIVWISLGAFRFMPDLKPVLQERHPHSRILYGEFIRGLDNKMRYFRDIRVDLYKFMVERIRKVDPGLCVYLCMEGADIWREAFGFSPEERGGLPTILDAAVCDRMGVSVASG